MTLRTDRLPTGPANVYFREKVTGLVTTASSTAIVGVGTYFTEELNVGDTLYIVGEAAAGFAISAIADDTHLTLGTAATTTGAGKVATADVNVGSIKNGIDLQENVQTFPVMIDQLGDTPADEVVSGKKVTLVLGLAEWSLKNFLRAMPETNAIIRSTTKRRMESTTSVGYSLLANAFQIRIKPLLDGKNETTDWNNIITLPLCAPTAQTLSIKFEPKTQRPIMATFSVFPDTAINDRLWYVGDPTA